MSNEKNLHEPCHMQKPSNDSLDLLARDIERLESLRMVKDIQRSYAQYAQFGLFGDMAKLFTEQGCLIWGNQKAEGRDAIEKWLHEHSGPVGTMPGALNTEMIDDMLINLSADGETALGRWRGLSFRGDGNGKAWIESGLYENTYARENGRWKLRELHYYAQSEGSYEDGWYNVDKQELPIVPYHFTLKESGIPIPEAQGDAPKSNQTFEMLSNRVRALNDADAVRNLQNAYGYYVDRRMWDDVVDLFAEDGLVEIDGRVYAGKHDVRKAMERMGPAGITYGILNDHLIFDTIVRVMPGGAEAYTRGTELGMIGDALAGTSGWEVNVFRNRFVKEGKLWKIREMRITQVMNADYSEGWGNGGTLGKRPLCIPAMLEANPASGEAVNTGDFKVVCAVPLTGVIASQNSEEFLSLPDLRRRYLRSLAWDGTENVSAAYGYFLDDWQWPSMAGVFAVNGHKASPFAGYYFGRDRIASAAKSSYGEPRDVATAKRAFIAVHWRTQPVIHVSHDGRSALLRTRLFHFSTGVLDDPPGGLFRRTALLQSGMYPNDQAVLEDGVWRLWSLTIDEPHFVMPGWKGGWSAAKPPASDGGIRPSKLLKLNPPDLLLSDLGHRAEGFPGGTGKKIDWPNILPMWFHYRNPVSGRYPELYWPDCVPSEKRPETSMTQHGYQMPPTGPSEDGIALD